MKTILRYFNQTKLLTLLFICLFFFILRLPSLFEPNWYGDEGIYQSIGFGLRSGREFYTGVWDNKPPLLFIIYAIASGDQFNARFISLVFGIAAVICFYSLSKKVFIHPKSRFVSLVIFTLFFGLPIIEGNIANSENFMLFPIILAASILHNPLSLIDKPINKSKKIKLLAGGIVLSLSFLIKIVTIFDFAAFLVFSFVISFYQKNISRDSFIKPLRLYLLRIGWFILGFVLPIAFSFIYFHLKGLSSYYVDAAFGRNVDYVGWANYFIIPQGLLYFRIFLLGIFIILIIYKRRIFNRSTLFIIIWLALSLFNAFFSNRGYTHYMLLILPSIALFTGTVFRRHSNKKNLLTIISCVIIITILYFNFDHWSVIKTFSYYGNFLKLTSGSISYKSYQEFFDTRNPKDYMIADYIKKKTNPHDTIFLWGNSAQIYPLSETLPPGRYSAAYHIVNTKESLDETEKALLKNRPKYIIITQDLPNLPFDISEYTYKITIEDTHIYEYVHK